MRETSDSIVFNLKFNQHRTSNILVVIAAWSVADGIANHGRKEFSDLRCSWITQGVDKLGGFDNQRLRIFIRNRRAWQWQCNSLDVVSSKQRTSPSLDDIFVDGLRVIVCKRNIIHRVDRNRYRCWLISDQATIRDSVDKRIGPKEIRSGRIRKRTVGQQNKRSILSACQRLNSGRKRIFIKDGHERRCR